MRRHNYFLLACIIISSIWFSGCRDNIGVPKTMQEGVNVVDELSQWKENGFLISDTTFSTDTNSIEEFREVESAKLDFG